MVKRLVGLKAIAAHLGRSENTVRRYIQVHGLPVHKVGGLIEADKQALDEWRGVDKPVVVAQGDEVIIPRRDNKSQPKSIARPEQPSVMVEQPAPRATQHGRGSCHVPPTFRPENAAVFFEDQDPREHKIERWTHAIPTPER